MNNDISVQYSTYTELLYSLTSSTFTHKPPIHCSLSRHMVFISVTGSLGQCRDRSSQVNTDMLADCGREQVSRLCLTPVQSTLFTCTPTDSRSPRVLGSAYWTAANFSPPNRNNLNAP